MLTCVLVDLHQILCVVVPPEDSQGCVADSFGGMRSVYFGSAYLFDENLKVFFFFVKL